MLRTTFFDMGLLLALYNYNGLVVPRLSLCNFWFSFHSVCLYVLGVFTAALRTPCMWWGGCSNNLQDLGKTQPRVELSTYQYRSGRTYY